MEPQKFSQNYPVTQTVAKSGKTYVWEGSNNPPFPTIIVERTLNKNGIAVVEATIQNMADSQGNVRITPNNVNILSFALELYKNE